MPTDVNGNVYINQDIHRGHVSLLLLKEINNIFGEAICAFSNVTFK